MSRSPGAMRPHLQAVLPPTLAALSFDPNYAEDMDADEDNADDDEDAVDECVSQHACLPDLVVLSRATLSLLYSIHTAVETSFAGFLHRLS